MTQTTDADYPACEGEGMRLYMCDSPYCDPPGCNYEACGDCNGTGEQQ